MPEPDPRLVVAAQAGDRRALAELVRCCQPEVGRFLRHLVGDADLAADLTQDTLVRMVERIGTFRFDARFTTWILRIARHLAVDEFRSRTRRRAREIAAAPDLSPSPSLLPELRMALAALPLPLREAFVLVEVFDMSYRDAADIVRAPIGTVKSRVFHARRQLVAWMRAGEDQSDAR